MKPGITSTAELNVTPVILTYNEEPNLSRALESLRWSQRVIVLDSGSTDATESIAKAYPNVDWYVRPFDRHHAQWQHGIHETRITTEYVLALDADMVVPQAFVTELVENFLPRGFSGATVPFEYVIYGRSLAGSILRAQLRLFRRSEVQVAQGGHTQEFSVNGLVYNFKAPLVHDDRKPLERWVGSQLSYSALEAKRLTGDDSSRLRDYLRRCGLMPPVMTVLAYLRAGGPFCGAAALRYSYERAMYESLLTIRLMNARLKRRRGSSGEDGPKE